MEKKFDNYEDCEKAVGLTPGTLPDVSMLPEKYRKSLIGDFQATIVTEAHNDGWEPDFSNKNQPKYSVWPEIKADKKRPTGFGFSSSGYADSFTVTFVGSRHLLKSPELAIHVLEQFPEIYQAHLLLK
ncbi:MAG: hypothetical protein K8R85_05815 [Bacteroidetes bacterium]|nr:hypothetical protein [Bacteroidota bacterium]